MGGDLGFEASLFKAADKLRGSMEPSDYKHVALGLIFLRHISGSFAAKRQALLAEFPDEAEDPASTGRGAFGKVGCVKRLTLYAAGTSAC